jgi:GNAT superfamily N-acetyltransferase
MGAPPSFPRSWQLVYNGCYYVLPEARGAGAGAALIEAVKAWCRKRGCTLVLVVVTPEGQAAHCATFAEEEGA